MAATSLGRQMLNPPVCRPAVLTSKRMCNTFPSLCPRAFNGEREQSSEEEARKGLKQLDEQLSDTSSSSSRRSPAPFYVSEVEDLQKKAISKGSLPEFSDGFVIFLGGGLLLLTVVNNFLFYYFVERPNKSSQVTQQSAGKEVESKDLSVDDSKAAPELQVRSNRR